jgi:hypothetical protein
LQILRGFDLKESGMRGRIILKLFLKKYCGRVWSGIIWLRIRLETNDRLL